MHRRLVCFAAASLFALAAGARANSVLVVSSQGPFTSVGPAYAAAADGDVILVKSAGPQGIYPLLALGGAKSITIVGERDVTGSPPYFHGISIGGVPAGRHVTVRGVASTDLFTTGGTQLSIQNNAGTVVLEDCVVSSFLAGTGVIHQIADSANVTLIRCILSGKNGSQSLFATIPPTPALNVSQSKVSFYECFIVGGGAATLSTSVQTPAPAIIASGGFLFASGGSIKGGKGAPGIDGGTCINGSDGAPAVLLQSGAPTLLALGTPLAGGAGGAQPPCATTPPAAGPPAQVDSGSFASYAESHRGLFASSPVRAGQSALLTANGPPGEAAFCFVGAQPNGAFVPQLKGALLPAFPLQLVALGSIPPSGVLGLSVPLPAGLLPAGLQALDVYVQIHVAGAAGTGIVGSPSVLTILDPAF